LVILENTAGPDHPRVTEIVGRYAELLERLGRHTEAAAVRGQAISPASELGLSAS
jgi:hypothetical protein